MCGTLFNVCARFWRIWTKCGKLRLLPAIDLKRLLIAQYTLQCLECSLPGIFVFLVTIFRTAKFPLHDVVISSWHHSVASSLYPRMSMGTNLVSDEVRVPQPIHTHTSNRKKALQSGIPKRSKRIEWCSDQYGYTGGSPYAAAWHNAKHDITPPFSFAQSFTHSSRTGRYSAPNDKLGKNHRHQPIAMTRKETNPRCFRLRRPQSIISSTTRPCHTQKPFKSGLTPYFHPT